METAKRARASLVMVGDELLLGRTVDTNGAWLAGALATLGLPVVGRTTVRDHVGDIQRAVARALETSDVVLVSGGLGPTHDDLTLDAVAGLLNRPLVEDSGLRESLEARFRARGLDPMPAPNLKMARVPRGGRVLGNPIGTAPALSIEEEHRSVILLPGVPRELKAIVRDLVRPYLVERLGRRLSPVVHREIHTTGAPESELARLLGGRLDGLPDGVSVAFLPGVAGVTLRLSARDDRDRAQAALDTAEELLAPPLAGVRFHASSGDLADAVAERLLRDGTTVATAESCTGGLVAKRLTDRPGSSGYYLGGVVAYSNDSKVRDLDVPPELLDDHGAVSGPVAEAMARGIRLRFGSQAGIAITGVAGPDGGTPEKPVGTVFYAVQLEQNLRSRREWFSGDREAVRERSAQAALSLLLRMLEGE